MLGEIEREINFARQFGPVTRAGFEACRRKEVVERPVVTLAARLWRGMSDHFRLRATSWIMSANMLAFGFTILGDPAVLSLPGRTVLYASLAHLFSPHTIGLMCVTLGGFRLMSLIINGTFPSFTLSPFIRAVGSFLSALFWLQIVFGALHSEVWTLALSVYCTFLAMDAFGLYIAALEIDPHGDGRA